MGRAGHLQQRSRRLTRLVGAGVGAGIALSTEVAAIEMTTRTHDAQPRQRAHAEGLRAAAAQATLRRIATAIAEGGTLDELLDIVVREGQVLLEAQRVKISLNDPDAGDARAATDRTAPYLDGLGRRTDTLTDRQHPRTFVAPIPGPPPKQAHVVAEGARSPEADLLIDELARLAGLARARADERARLHALARTDALTGLPNRRAFDERLVDEVSTARRFDHPLSLAIIDIDRFKRVNDAFGHAVGDKTLRAVCRAIAGQTRLEDLVARVGGEEIALVMPGAEPQAATSAAERALESIRRLALPIGRVTASCGLAQLAGSDANGCDLLRRADRALYQAKASGRDRLALA